MRPTFFATPDDFRAWLEAHHEEQHELWVGFYKNGSGKPSITWPEAVDQALCFGWIDGVRKSIDDVSYANRFTPRKARSHWSAVNVRREGAAAGNLVLRRGVFRTAMRSIGTLVALAALICASVAAAKDFRPGDLRLCGAARCVAVADRGALRDLSAFIYGTRGVTIVRSPSVGAPAYELRFKNGYVAGMVGTTRLDRFRSQGVICGRFRTGKWYRLPIRVSRELRTLAAPLEPLRLSRVVPRSC